MTEAYLVLGALAAGGIAYLAREYRPTFLVSAGLTWLFATVQWFLGNIGPGCRYSSTLVIHNPLEQAIYGAVPAVMIGAVALLFAYALKLHAART